MNCPQRTDDDRFCSGVLQVTTDGPWREYRCTNPECGYEACRHMDSTGPIREQEHDDDYAGHWSDR